MARRSDSSTQAAWEQRMARFGAAGGKAADFCAAEGVSLASFYAWRRKLGLTRPRDRRSRRAFQQLVVHTPSPVLAVKFPGDVHLEVVERDAALLSVVIRELVQAARGATERDAAC